MFKTADFVSNKDFCLYPWDFSLPLRTTYAIKKPSGSRGATTHLTHNTLPASEVRPFKEEQGNNKKIIKWVVLCQDFLFCQQPEEPEKVTIRAEIKREGEH